MLGTGITMLNVNIFSKEELFEHVSGIYPLDDDKSLLPTVSDLKKLFCDVDKPEWLLLEYVGDVAKIERLMSTLSINVLLKYMLHLTLPTDVTLEDAFSLKCTITESNLYDSPDHIFVLTRSDELSSGDVSFSIIAPRYTYFDLWKEGLKL